MDYRKFLEKIFWKGNQPPSTRVLGGWYTRTPVHLYTNILIHQYTNTQISKILSLFFDNSEKMRIFVYGNNEKPERSRSRSRYWLQRFSLPVPNSSLIILKDGSCVGYVAWSLHYTGIYAAMQYTM